MLELCSYRPHETVHSDGNVYRTFDIKSDISQNPKGEIFPFRKLIDDRDVVILQRFRPEWMKNGPFLYLTSDCDSHLTSELRPVTFIGRKSPPEDVVSIDIGRSANAASANRTGRPPFVLMVKLLLVVEVVVVRGHDDVAGHRVTRSRIGTGSLMSGFRAGRSRFAVFAKTEHGAQSFQKEAGSVGVLLFALARFALVVEHRNANVRRRSGRRHHFIDVNRFLVH